MAFKQAMMGGLILMLIEGASQLFMAISMRNQHLAMQQQIKEMRMREMAMASRGGENPWEVDYKKEQADKIAESEAGANMADGGATMMEKATKSFSF